MIHLIFISYGEQFETGCEPHVSTGVRTFLSSEAIREVEIKLFCILHVEFMHVISTIKLLFFFFQVCHLNYISLLSTCIVKVLIL